MLRIRATLSFAAIFFCSLFAQATAVQSAARTSKSYPLWNFEEMSHTCWAKGRLQDRDHCGSHLLDKIVADRRDAMPILISHLRDTRPTKEPIYDYWSLTTAGDIAYFIRNDLFTDSDWKTFTMPGMDALNDKDCHSYGEDCWQRFLKKDGRKFVQDQGLAAWKKNKDRVYWNEEARCFRLQPESTVNSAPRNQ